MLSSPALSRAAGRAMATLFDLQERERFRADVIKARTVDDLTPEHRKLIEAAAMVQR